MNQPTRRLAAHTVARQRHVVKRADRAADVAEAAVRAVWAELLAALDLPWHCAGQRVALLMRMMPFMVRRRIALELRRAAVWGSKSSRAGIAEALPAAALRRVVDDFQERSQNVQTAVRLTEEDPVTSVRPEFSWADLFFPFRDWQRAGVNPDDFDRDELLSLLFPAPSAERIDAVVFSSGWEARIASGTGLGDPAAIAARISTGLMLGQSQQEIARELRPLVQGVQASARRIARTECLRVAAAVQMDAHETLGELVVGYTVRASIDKNTRWWHAKRDGTTYYRDPAPGQKSYHQMPHPPEEAADPAERPIGTPQLSFN